MHFTTCISFDRLLTGSDFMRSLLEGNINKQLIALALPLILGNILQQFYNTVDSFIAGQWISQNAFSAIGTAGSMMNLFIFMINGCCNGITIIFSQYYGERNELGIKKEMFISLVFGLCFVFLLSFIGLLNLTTFLKLMSTPQCIFLLVKKYLTIIILFLFITFIYNWSSSVLRSFGDSKMALYVLGLSVFINIVLDIIFVVIFHQGVQALAYATIISQLISSLCSTYYLIKRYPFVCFKLNQITNIKPLLKTTINYGLISALHQSSLYLGKLFIQGAINSAGMNIVTAYAVTTRIEGLINSFGDSGCAAISILVGQNYGAHNTKRTKETLFKGLKLMISLSIILSIIIVLLTKPMTLLFVEKSQYQVIHETFIYMFVVCIFYVFCFIGNVFVGFYRGIGRVDIPFKGTTMHVTLRVILSYLLIHHLGLVGVALGCGVGWIFVNIYQVYQYKKLDIFNK